MGEPWERKTGRAPTAKAKTGKSSPQAGPTRLLVGPSSAMCTWSSCSSAALATHLLEECRRAMHSDGWTAVVPHLGDDEPPARIVISRAGVSPAE